MDVPVGLEVGGQVVVGVAPAVGAHHPHLTAADRLPQRPQHAQLVGNPLHSAPLVDHGIAPRRRHDPVEGDLLLRPVEALRARTCRPPAQQLEGVDHRAPGGVVAPERQSREQPRQHAAVVGRVRRGQHGANLSAERVLVRLALAHQVPQGGLADDRVQRLAHGVVGVLDRRLGQPEQDAVLAPDPAQVGEQLGLDPALGPAVDAVNQGDEQLDEAVGDLRRATPAQCRQQAQAHPRRGAPQVRGVAAGGTGLPGGDHLVGHIFEQVGGQADGPYSLELVQLPEQRLEAKPARVRLQLSQHPGAVVLAALGHQLVQPSDRLIRQPAHGASGEVLVEGLLGAAEDTFDAAGGRWFDPQGAAPGHERLPPALLRQLERADLLGEPSRERVLVGERGFAKAQGFADLGPVVLDRAARPLVVGEGLG